MKYKTIKGTGLMKGSFRTEGKGFFGPWATSKRASIKAWREVYDFHTRYDSQTGLWY